MRCISFCRVMRINSLFMCTHQRKVQYTWAVILLTGTSVVMRFIFLCQWSLCSLSLSLAIWCAVVSMPICNIFFHSHISKIFVLQVMWGKASMVDAEKRLLANALEDPDNEHFVLLSDRYLMMLLQILSYYKHYVLSDSNQTLSVLQLCSTAYLWLCLWLPYAVKSQLHRLVHIFLPLVHP